MERYLDPEIEQRPEGAIDELMATIHHFKSNLYELVEYLNRLDDNDALQNRMTVQQIIENAMNLIFVLGRKRGK